MLLAMVISQFNKEVTDGLRQGAFDFLTEKGINEKQIQVFEAPGAFEIPLIAQTLAKTKKFDGVVCLGCVVKGDTAHFEFISLGATMGIQQAILATETPITFGILTTYTDEQAFVRSRPDANNKGREAAAACIEAIETLKLIRLHSW
jgi:6,7-dimethyl-8-ribityllumazine synthase